MSSTWADVEQLLEQRVPFVRIEEYVEGRRDISEDDRDGLWLYAWSRCGDTRSESVAVGHSAHTPGPAAGQVS